MLARYKFSIPSVRRNRFRNLGSEELVTGTYDAIQDRSIPIEGNPALVIWFQGLNK
jgi:hypothetical protein